MADAILRIKTVMDVGDVVSNVGVIQKSLSKLKLPDNLKNNLNKNIGAFYKEYEKYQKKMSDGIKTQGDFNQIERSLNHLKSLYTEIGKDAAKAIKIDPEALFNLDEGKFKGIVAKIEQTLKQLNDVKIDTKAFSGPIEEIEKLTKNQKIVGDGGILTRMMGNIDTGNISQAKKEYNSLIQEIQKAAPKLDEFGKRINKPGTFSVDKYNKLQEILSKLGTAFAKAGTDVRPLEEELNRLQAELAETVSASSKDLIGQVGDYNKQAEGVEKVTDSLKRMHEEEYNFNRQAQDIDRQIQTYFGLSQMIRKVADIARDAFATVKDLDAAMVETAVVTNFDVGDMWNMLPTYTANANQLGSTIKDVYEAATLYYQQGLNQAQSMGLANETLKMARIGGLQAAEATNMMTAALRGFNMEINQVSAKRINDVYSELAAITAADTKEIGSAMERTASIANSANMEFETTSAFLAQMIETTREAPENLGTAMKTIIARFQEMKQDPTKLVDSEGVALDANKIDTALKTIGVDLKNSKGEFRDLDTVFLEISEKWDSLTQGQQRYIATIAAGSRQQSRFIAMMQNYERVKELVDAANNSAGASQKQFEKTLDSMSSKLNRLKNAWDQFTMGLMNNQFLKGGVDILTGFFTVVNKIFDILTKPFPDPFGGLIKSAITLVSTLGMLQLGKKGARGLVMGGVGWWKDEGGFAKNFAKGWGVGKNSNAMAGAAGAADGAVYTKNFNAALKKFDLKTAFTETKKRASQIKNGVQYENTFAAAFGQDPKVLSSAIQAQGLDGPLAKEIENVFARACARVDTTDEARVAAQKFAKELQSQIASGEISAGQAAESFKMAYGVDVGNMGVNEIEKVSTGFDKIGFSIQNASSSLQTFGMALQGTPLAPFGMLLSTVGGLIGGLAGQLKTVVGFGQAFVLGMGEVVAAEGMAATGTAMLAGGFKALWAAMLESPLLPIIAAIGAIVGAYKLLDAAIETDKEKLESTSDAAAAASEAFDSAKQETSELNDAISRIQENENAFDNLVAGTADFNEQMVTANEQITELLRKYPMLNDYVSTDKNGLMHVSEAGLTAVKEYQKQIQAHASAMNIIQSADLAALENRQKAEKILKKITTDSQEREKNREEAKLLYDRAKADKQLAQRNAIRTALNAQELKEVEAISAVYANLYETKRKSAQVEVEEMSKQDRRQQYADYHGYTYNKSTKKMKDTEGNEVDYDDKVIKDEVIEQTVMLDFEANAGTLNNVLAHLDEGIQSTLGKSFEGANHLISDILSGNMETNTDALEKVLGNPKDFQKIVNDLNKKEVAAILGISAEEIKKDNFDDYKNQVVDLLTERATSLAEAQYESYEKLGAMMAEATYGSRQIAKKDKNQQEIRKQIQDLKTYQANTLSTVGQTLQENVGTDAMTAFISNASDIYLKSGQKVIDEFDGILGEINWESPASRLEAYNKAINSSESEIQQWGQSMRSAASEANILGNAFDEFVGGDWEKLSENADEFKNSMGQIDGAGILKASEQSKSLKAMLDSGEVSATAVAQALQGIEDGKYSIGAVDSVVLQLLSSLNRLADTAQEAHNIIENFDAGIDYGEGEDFVKENAEKAKAYYDNGEWGNQQLQNYIKLAAGTDKWNKALEKNHGDFEKTTNDLMKYVTTFSEGFQPAWDQMISGKNINGESLSKAIDNAKIDDKLKEKFRSVKVFWDEEGFMDLNLGDLTTSELESYFQEIYSVSQEYAKLLMQDLANYDGDISARLAKNDLLETINSGKLDVGRNYGENGKTVLTDAELQVIKSAPGGAEALETLARNLGYVEEGSKTAAEVMEGQAFRVTDKKTGKEREDYGQLTKDYAKTFFKNGQANIGSLLNRRRLQDDSNRLDLNKLVTDMRAKSFSQEQAMQSAWKTYQTAQKQGKDTSFDGVKFKEGIKNYQDFVAEMEKGPEHVEWYSVGQSIADGILSVINKDKKDEEDKSKIKEEKDKERTRDKSKGNERRNTTDEARKGFRETGSTIAKGTKRLTESGGGPETKSAYGSRRADITTTTDASMSPTIIQGKIDAINNSFNNLLSGLNAKSFNTEGAQNALDKLYKAFDTGDPVTLTGKLKGQMESLGINVEDAIKSGLVIDTKGIVKKGEEEGKKTGDAGSKAGKKIVEDTAKNTTKGVELGSAGGHGGKRGLIEKGPKAAQEVQTGIPKTQETTLKVKTEESGLKEAKDKVDKLKNAASKQQTIKIGAKTNKSTSDALDSIKKIREAAKKKNTVSVDAKVKGKEDTNNLGSVIKSVKAKAVKIAAKVTGANKVSSLRSEINRLQNKTVTITTNKVTHTRNDLKGQNNYIPHRTIPSFGSAARGYRGRVGPKNRGGLTLTGEKGFEIAWLPSENRSMILGTEGPQMLSLPNDAVVYTHEQSEDILKKRQTIDAGSSRTGRQNTSGKNNKSSKKGKKKSKKKSKKKNSSSSKGSINNFSIEEVVRFNIDPALARLTNEIEKRTKEIEKSLTKIGNTYGDIVDSANKQITALQGVKDKNQALYDSYQRQLAELLGQKGSVSWTDDKGKSHDKTINFSSFLNSDGSVNQAAIARLSTRAEREATFNLVSGAAKPLVEGMQSTQKAIEDAQQQIDDLGQKISEAFYQWENELTEIYDLTQRINDETSLTSRFTSQIELELAKLNAGFGNTVESISNIRKVLTRNNDVIQKQVENQQQMIAARQRELQSAYSIQEELDLVNKYKNATNVDSATKQANINWANERLTAATLGQKYVKNIFKDIDGHIEYEIDWEKFNAENDQSPYNKSTYEAIKKYLDDLNNAATEFNNAIEDQTKFIKETYDALKEYQDKIADIEDTLINGVEEEVKTETENNKKISDTIRDSLKDLLDEVKRKLDERRQQEDNAKTEKDIAQKQQRLAALRADTSGGNQVEIAQLEKEIADAQQDYGRTLEDQLLNRLEQQADDAAQQRERQIELAETLNDLSSSTNKELVDMWLKDPERYKEEIKNAWLEANNYSEKGEAGQYVLEQEFESTFAELVTAVKQSGFDSINGIFTATADNTTTLVNLLNQLNNDLIGRDDELTHALNAQTDATDRNTESLLTVMEENYTAAQLKQKGVDAGTLKKLGYTAKDLIGDNPEEPIYTVAELKEAGFTATDVVQGGITNPQQLKSGGYTAQEVKDTGITDFAKLVSAYTLSELKGAGFNQNDFGANNISYENARTLYSAQDLLGVSQYSSQADAEIKKIEADAAAKAEADRKAAADAATQAEADYKNAVVQAASNKKIGKDEILWVQAKANAAGHSARTWMQALADTAGLTWKQVITAAKAAGFSKYSLAKTFSSSAFISAYNDVYGKNAYATNKKSKNGSVYSYKTGGLANYTGPAWLDGTPAKPELVLNAADTKNFLALKDVLSKVMTSTSSIQNSYGGDTNFEVNINVDHLNSDYDVDKVADRVRKIIIKDAGYRNVTQVRNFR